MLKKDTFRMLVAALGVSFVYDLLWLITETKQDDGNVESRVHNFSYALSIISMLLRVNHISNYYI